MQTQLAVHKWNPAKNRKCFLSQPEDAQECQDIDLARFVPREVDSDGITVASADRFSSKSQVAKEADGERARDLFKTGE